LLKLDRAWTLKQSSWGSTPALFNTSNSTLSTKINVLQYNTLQQRLSTVSKRQQHSNQTLQDIYLHLTEVKTIACPWWQIPSEPRYAHQM